MFVASTSHVGKCHKTGLGIEIKKTDPEPIQVFRSGASVRANHADGRTVQSETFAGLTCAVQKLVCGWGQHHKDLHDVV